MKLIDFFPIYPETIDDNFQDKIGNKCEFSKYKLEKQEEQNMGQKYNHQVFLSRFMSGFNTYDELILYHEMGTGKTTTAINIAESLIKTKSIKHVYILSRGENLMKSFQKELATVGSNFKYAPRNFKEVNGNFYQDNELITSTMFYSRIKKLYSKYYTFDTYQKFVKDVRNKYTDDLNEKYSNCLFIMDEIHNVRDTSEHSMSVSDIYNDYKGFFDKINYRKILLLSGTLMVDKPSELSSIMNLLIKDKDKQLVSGKDFNRYIENIPELVSLIKGRISYIKNMKSDVKINYKGETKLPLTNTIIYPSIMSPYQTNQYLDRFNTDSKNSYFISSRKASIYVDGETFLQHLNRVDTQKNILDVIKEYSSKYYEIIKKLLENEKENMFIFQFFVSDKAVKNKHFQVLSICLQKVGFVKFNPSSKTKTLSSKPRYAVITSQTSAGDAKLIEQVYNSPQNKHGEKIRVIIGSEAISEGISFKNVQQIHIVNPFWNNGKLSQAIYRGIRLNSHKDLDDPKVDIYQHVSLVDESVHEEDDDDLDINSIINKFNDVNIDPNKEEDEEEDDEDLDEWIGDNMGVVNVNIPVKYHKSIDLYMYGITELKKSKIEEVNNIIQEYAVDKYLTCNRNGVNVDFNSKPDYTSQQRWYPDDNISELTDFLQTYFNGDFSIHIDDLYRMFNTISKFQITMVIDRLITENQIFINKNGIKSYLRYDNNILFLVSNIRSSESYLESYYNSNVILQQNIELNVYTEQESLKNNREFFDNVVNDNDSLTNIMSIKPQHQSHILELALLSKKNSKGKEWILNHYLPYTFNIGGNLVHNVIKMSNQGKLRICIDGVWKDTIDEGIIKQVNVNLSEKFKNDTNSYGIYSFINKNINTKNPEYIDGVPFYIDNFKYRDISNPDKMTLTTGIVCKTMTLIQLLKLSEKMDLSEYIPDENITSVPDSVLKKITSKRSELENIKLELENGDNNTILKYNYYGSNPKKVIIKDMYQYYKKNNLLVWDI